MEKIAVIGCSNTEGIITPDGDVTLDEKNWAAYLSDKFPNKQFDIYAHGGCGVLAHNTLLQKVYKNYDKIIIQHTHEPRSEFFVGDISYIKVPYINDNCHIFMYDTDRYRRLYSSCLLDYKKPDIVEKNKEYMRKSLKVIGKDEEYIDRIDNDFGFTSDVLYLMRYCITTEMLIKTLLDHWVSHGNVFYVKWYDSRLCEMDDHDRIIEEPFTTQLKRIMGLQDFVLNCVDSSMHMTTEAHKVIVDDILMKNEKFLRFID